MEHDDEPVAVRVWRDKTRALWDEDANGRMYRVDSPDNQDQNVAADWVRENFGPLTQEWPPAGLLPSDYQRTDFVIGSRDGVS